MDDCKKLTDCLETILNLQREHQEAMKGLEQESRQLLQKVREINVRAAGLQMEVMEVQDALHPPCSGTASPPVYMPCRAAPGSWTPPAPWP